MSDGAPRPRRAREPFVIAVLVVLVAGLVFAGIAINNIAGKNSASGLPGPSTRETTSTSPAPVTSATPTAASTLAPTSCATATFGAPLQPQGQPADVHVYGAPPPLSIDTTKLYRATITMAGGGVIVICLEPSLAPNTVNNFVTLARNHFYDGLKFHRVVPDFVIQGGDPKGDGSGGPGYQFVDEPVKGNYIVGAVAMANSGPNTNGSQFFICIGSQCPPLPHKYNLFGHLVSGLDVALKIQQGDVMTSVVVAAQQ